MARIKPKAEAVADIEKLTRIYNEAPTETDDLEPIIERLRGIAKFIGDVFIRTLGASTDYSIGFTDPNPLGGGLFQRDIIVAGKSDFDAKALDDVFAKTWKSFLELNLNIDDGLYVIDSLMIRIEDKCSIRYQFITDNFHVLNDDWSLPVAVNENDIVYPPSVKRPVEVVAALADLKLLAQTFVINKTKLEIDPLGLAEKVIEIKRRIANSCNRSLIYREAMESLLRQLEGDVDLERERKEIHEPIKISDSAENDEANDEDYEPDGANSLSIVCPQFANAMPETRRTAWKIMQKFTRKQWAYFTDLTRILHSSTAVERARRIEEISGRTNLRDLFGRQPTAKDKAVVNKAITLLKADMIKAQDA